MPIGFWQLFKKYKRVEVARLAQYYPSSPHNSPCFSREF
jgi:hypothetical protein